MLSLELIKNTFQKEIRNKGIIFLFFFSILALYLGQQISVSVQGYLNESNLNTFIANSAQAIIVNFVSIISVIVSTIVGVSCIRSDISSRVLPQILTFPISRMNYILSRVIGAFLIGMFFYSFNLIFGVLILKFSNSISIDFVPLVANYFLMGLVLFSIVLFSSFTSVYLNKIGTLIITFLFYVLSKVSFYNYLNDHLLNSDLGVWKVLQLISHYALPRIGEFNYISDGYLSGKLYDLRLLGLSLLHFLCVIIIWSYLFKFLFDKKEI